MMAWLALVACEPHVLVPSRLPDSELGVYSMQVVGGGYGSFAGEAMRIGYETEAGDVAVVWAYVDEDGFVDTTSFPDIDVSGARDLPILVYGHIDVDDSGDCSSNDFAFASGDIEIDEVALHVTAAIDATAVTTSAACDVWPVDPFTGE